MRIGITKGLRGWFAVLYDDLGPVQSGIGSYETPTGAAKEAWDWAQSEFGVHMLDSSVTNILGVQSTRC